CVYVLERCESEMSTVMTNLRDSKKYVECTLIILLVGLIAGCGQTDTDVETDEYVGTGEVDTTTLGEDPMRSPMRHDPQMLRSMMRDTTVMRRMMADTSMMNMMAQRMAE